ncbi:hypothetical protein KP509_11G036300 [Ceratopteris richardii]|uniref:Major facilitator superfamily (MFS) profile domain-containing protein n=1 Tax=Ceratopteris richardii TaxID=49495 RepID=A0A8T2TRF4_CERRI|nr:hypothetical protein KP509_11G036300 [Ceratopteris richardii]
MDREMRSNMAIVNSLEHRKLDSEANSYSQKHAYDEADDGSCKCRGDKHVRNAEANPTENEYFDVAYCCRNGTYELKRSTKCSKLLRGLFAADRLKKNDAPFDCRCGNGLGQLGRARNPFNGDWHSDARCANNKYSQNGCCFGNGVQQLLTVNDHFSLDGTEQISDAIHYSSIGKVHSRQLEETEDSTSDRLSSGLNKLEQNHHKLSSGKSNEHETEDEALCNRSVRSSGGRGEMCVDGKCTGQGAQNAESMSIDELLSKWVGEFGRAQIIHFALTSLAWALEALHTLVPIFADKIPAWRCMQGSACSYETSCSASGSSSSLSCGLCRLSPLAWEWIRKDESTVSEWNLVCQSSYMQGLAQSAFFFGCLLGAGLFGHLSDSRLGRRGALVLACLLNTACGMLTAASPSYGVYTLLRAATGVCSGGLGLTSFVLGTEMIGPSRRTSAAMTSLYFFPLGMLLLVGLAASTAHRSWRFLYIVTSAPSMLYCIFILPFLAESPRWYLVRGRTEDALRVLRSVARRNGTVVPDSIVLRMDVDGEEHAACGHAEGPVIDHNRSNFDHSSKLASTLGNAAISKPNGCSSGTKSSLWMLIPAVGCRSSKQDDRTSKATVLKTEVVGELQLQSVLSERSPSVSVLSNGWSGEGETQKRTDDDGEDPQEKPANGTLMDVFRCRDLRTRMLILIVVWFASAMGYYVFNLNVGNLGTNLTVSVLLNAIAEVPGYAITACFLNRVGRRITVICSLLLTACSTLVGAIVSYQLAAHPTDADQHHHTPHSVAHLRASIQLTCNLVGLFAIAGTYNLLFLYTSELFPTVVRNAALGLANQAGAVGSIIAPIVVFSAHVNTTLPFFIVGGICLISGILAIKLPETLNCPFHETLESMRRASYQP